MSKPITPSIIFDVITLSAPSLSPDGARLAFVQTKIDRQRMATRSRIMVTELAGGSTAQFTAGDKDAAPRYSPDGGSIAFVRSDEADRRQLWVMPTAGGEGRRLTSVPGGVTDVAWSPDSLSLAFVSDVDPDLAPDDPDNPATQVDKKQPRVRVVRRIRYWADATRWRGDAFRHIFVVDVESGETRQLTSNKGGEGDDSAPAWSPDGTKIAFIGDRRDDREVATHSDLFVVSASGDEPSGKMERWSAELSSVAALAWSPDGQAIAVVASDDDEVEAGLQGSVFVLEPDQPPRRLTDDSISPAGGYAPVIPAPEMRWTSDGHILFFGDARGRSALYRLSAASGELRAVSGGDSTFNAVTFDAECQQAVVLSVPPTSVGDLHLIDVGSGSSKQLTELNRDYFREHPPARLEKFTLSRGGVDIESRLLLPHDFDPPGTYPLVLHIHGGPHGVFSDAFETTQQLLASAGYIVLAVNPRGSSTYGADFMKAVQGDWGGEDYLDIMAAVDEACRRDYVDSSRLGIMGYSYGGFMSSWIIGHDTRFSAAVVGAPCIDLPSMYGTSDIGVRFGEVQWGGQRRDALDAYLERSPLTYAANVETPVLLLHGEDDARCPIEQSEQYFVALSRLGKEVELVRFPGSAHGFTRTGHPRMREEYLTRLLAWMDRHVGAQRSEVPATEPLPADGRSR